MNCLPVIVREMQSASRRPWTFRLRLMFAVFGFAACLVMLVMPNMTPARKGQNMLILLTFLSQAFCLMAGGFLTADCVSGEKREGTLGLLLLTPLRGLEIVLGKLVCHGLQTLYALCALCPVFFLPLLTGGVTGEEIVRILLALGLSLVLAMSVGIFFSVFGQESRTAMVRTLTAILLITALPMLFGLVLTLLFPRATALGEAAARFSPVGTVVSGFDWSYRRLAGPWAYWSSFATIAGMSAVLVVSSGLLLLWNFRRGAEVREPAPERPRERVPLLGANAYEWLVLRSGRPWGSLGWLVRGALAFSAFMFAAAVLTPRWRGCFAAAILTAFGIHVVVKLRFAITATRQIHSDHRSGAMELLLVSLLSERSVLRGHHAALRRLARSPFWSLILLNLALELAMCAFPNRLHVSPSDRVAFGSMFIGGIVLVIADFWTLRWLALWHGLRAASHVKAAMLTFGWTMVPSWIALGLGIAVYAAFFRNAAEFAVMISFWVVLSALWDVAVILRCVLPLRQSLRLVAAEGQA